jgi:putative acetyltransferase
MTDVRIRALEPRDVEAVAEIMGCPRVVAGTLQLPWRSVEERRERLAQRSADAHRLVAEVDGRVVGIVALHQPPAPRRRHCGEIGMAVHDDFQGRGVGRALLSALVDLADNWLGLRRLELHVYVDNAPAIHLYERHGFVVEGTARDFAFRDGTYVDAHSMARLRTPPGSDPR